MGLGQSAAAASTRCVNQHGQSPQAKSIPLGKGAGESLTAGDTDDGWYQLRCLYAYWARNDELLYIGRAWGKTVYERWRREAKAHFWNDLERDRKFFEHGVTVGTIDLMSNERLTKQLLSDVESLLIYQTKPWGNIQCRDDRIVRPGLIVNCRGDCPLIHARDRSVSSAATMSTSVRRRCAYANPCRHQAKE